MNVASLSVKIAADVRDWVAGIGQFESSLTATQTAATQMAAGLGRSAADALGRTAALAQGAQRDAETVKAAMQTATTAVQQFGATKVDGERVAERFLTGLTARFRAAQTDAREALFQGVLSSAEFAQRGQQAAVEFNQAITREIQGLADAGTLTEKTRAMLVGAYKQAGLEAGQAFETQVTQQITTAASRTGLALNRLGPVINERTNQFTSFGRRGAQALFAVGYAAQSFANETEGGVRRAVRSVESFLLFFGEEGFIAAAVVQVGEVIYDTFAKAEKKVNESVQRMAQSVATALNSVDNIAAMKTLREIQYGTPFSVDPKTHELVANKRSQYAANAYEGSGADLEAHLADVNAKIAAATHAGNVALVGALSQTANALESQLAPIRARYNTIRDAILNPPDQSRLPGVLKPITTTIAADNTEKEMRAIGERMRKVAEMIAREFHPVTVHHLFDFDGQDTERLKALYKNALASVKPDLKAGGPFADLDATVALQQWSQLRGQIMHAGTDQVLSPTQQAALEAAKKAAAEISLLGLSPETVNPLFENILKKLKEAGVNVDALTRKSSGLADVFRGVGDSLHGLADAATILGNKDLAAVLNTGGNLANNAGAFQQARELGSVSGQISAGIGMFTSGLAVLSTIFSNDSENHRAMVQELRKNSERMETLSLRLAGFTSSAANQDRVASALRGMQTGGLGLFSFFGLDAQRQILDPQLARYGLTLEQVKQVAKDMGFTITNPNGTINQKLWDDFAKGLGLASQALFTFNKNVLGEQRSYLDLRDKLAGKTTPQDELNRSVEAFNAMTKHTALNLGGVDTATAQGRAALRAQLQQELERAIAGAVPIADFGNFQNLQEFEQAVGSIADGLNAMDQAVNNVTAALTNVPSGYKIALDRFTATIGAITPPGGSGVPSIPAPTPVVGTDLYGTPRLTPSANLSAPVVNQGDTYEINITVDGATLADPKQIASAIADELYTALGTVQQQQAARGGATRWSVASRQGGV
jgi:DNA-binding NarL/FixJ family response regulator